MVQFLDHPSPVFLSLPLFQNNFASNLPKLSSIMQTMRALIILVLPFSARIERPVGLVSCKTFEQMMPRETRACSQVVLSVLTRVPLGCLTLCISQSG